jgi:NADH-ubiquinone oxidoreductase chain 6
VLIVISLTYTLFQILPYDIAILNNYNNIWNNKLYNLHLNENTNYIYKNKLTNIYNEDFTFVTSNSWDANLLEINHISSIGNILYTSHNIWLIITSFILLLAMIGAIIITIKPNNN